MLSLLIASALFSSNPILDVIIVVAIPLACLLLWAWLDLSYNFHKYRRRPK